MEKVLIIYHRVDFDGAFSGSIANKFAREIGCTTELFGWTYGDDIPDIKYLEKFNRVVLVDLSFPPEVMIYLKSQNNFKVIWIDHHITAINNSYSNNYSDIEGLRRDGTAACELCWEYFYPALIFPKVVEFIGCYDVWDKTRYSWDNIILPFQYGLRTRYSIKAFMISPQAFNNLIFENIDLDEIIHEGEIILKYLDRSWNSACKVYSFDVKVAGKYRGICILTTEFTSNIFNSVRDNYDVVICCNRRGPDVYNLSMYKDTNKCPEFSCGGYRWFNGQKCAAGCTVNFEEFKKLITECEI